MNRMIALIAAALLAVIAATVLVLAFSADTGTLGPDVAWIEPLFGTGGVIVGGLTLAAAFLLFGLAMGRWENPQSVGDAEDRHREGLRG